MDLSTVEIDAIVRAVIERLTAAARSAESLESRAVAPSASPAPLASPTAISAASAAAPPSNVPDATAATRVTALSDSVITLRTLAGLGAQVRQIRVVPKAVLTPSARDWLRQRGIEVLRSAASDSTETAAVSTAPIGKLYIHSNGGLPRGNAWRTALTESNWEWESLVACPTPQAVAELSAVLGPANRLALLVTRDTYLAVCYANRHSNVRAITASTVDEAREAYRQLRANLLVVDPSRTPDYALGRVLREFLRPGPRSAAVEQRGGV